MKQSATDVLIVGAGPTGLTVAMALAQRGIAFRLIEQERIVNALASFVQLTRSSSPEEAGEKEKRTNIASQQFDG